MTTPPMIFDIGANNGDDTAAYLKRGYKVVSVEANPKLCKDLRQRFSSEIEEGRLVVIDKAISRRKRATLYVNSFESGWGTTSDLYASKGLSLGGNIEPIEVETTTLTDIIRVHGSPEFIKIDIEGADTLCLLDLFDADAPRSISIERPRGLGAQLFALELLTRLGYNRFQIVDQSKAQEHPTLTFTPGDSGLFGDELPNSAWMGLSGTWARSCVISFRSTIMRRVPFLRRFALVGKWFDIHATSRYPSISSRIHP
jgi:FkbM family methyltransferase